MNLDDALQHYLDDLDARQLSQSHIYTVKSRVGRFVRKRPDKSLEDVTRQDIAAFFRRQEEGRTEGTMAGIAASHRAFWTWVRDKGWLETDLGRDIKRYSYKPNVRQPVPIDHLRAVVDALPDFLEHRGRLPRDIRDTLTVSVSIDSAGRLGEIKNMRVQDARRALEEPRRARNGRIAYAIPSRGKTGSSHLVVFSESAMLLREWLEYLPPRAVYVFCNLNTYRKLSSEGIAKAYKRICKFAEVPTFRFQAVRKRDVTDVKRNEDIETARRFAGHSTLEVTRTHYVEAADQDVIDAAAEVAAHNRGDDDMRDDMADFFGIEET